MRRGIAVVLAVLTGLTATGCPEFTAQDAPTFEAAAAVEAPPPQVAPPAPPARGPNVHVRPGVPAGQLGAVPAQGAPNVRVIPTPAHGAGAP